MRRLAASWSPSPGQSSRWHPAPKRRRFIQPSLGWERAGAQNKAPARWPGLGFQGFGLVQSLAADGPSRARIGRPVDDIGPGRALRFMDKGVFDPTSSKIEILVGPDRYEEPESEDELLDVDAICAKDFDRVWREQELTCPGSWRSGRRPFRHRLSALKADRSSRSSWSPAARARRLSLRRLHRPCPRHRSRASGQGPRCRARPRIRHEERRPADLVARCRSLFRGREPAHRAPTPIIGQSKSRSSSQWPIRSPTLTRQAFRAMPQPLSGCCRKERLPSVLL